MTHPLFSLARKLDARAAKRRSLTALEVAQMDPHLARDIGLPYRPAQKRRVELW